MATSPQYKDFILEQLRQLPGISARPMMGEYVLYYNEKIPGGIYDNRLMVKPTKEALALLPTAPKELPYPGGSPMLLVEDVENQEVLSLLFQRMWPELPFPKKRQKKGL